MMREHEKHEFDAGGGEGFDPTAQFGDVIDKICAGTRARMPESLKAEALFMRFEGLLGDAPGAMESDGFDERAQEVPEPVVISAPRLEKKQRGFAFYMPRVLAAAACLAIGVMASGRLGFKNVAPGMDANSDGSGAASPFAATEGDSEAREAEAAADYSELRGTIYDIQKSMGYYYAYDGAAKNESGSAATPGGMGAMDDMLPMESQMEAEMAPAPMAPQGNPATAGGLMGGADMGATARSDSVYKTNTQESGIDEADIIKTDGEYLYVYRFNQKTASHEIAIIEADGLKAMSAIDIGERAHDGSLYLDGDYMVLIHTRGNTSDITYGTGAKASLGSMASGVSFETASATSSAPDEKAKERYAADVAPAMPGFNYGGNMGVVEVTVYDIKDRKAPAEVASYIQDGNYLTSRYMDGIVYTVTNKGVWNEVTRDDMPMSYVVPLVGRSGTLDIMPADDIIISPYLASPSYVTVTATDIRTGDSKAQSVLGVADTVYMSYESLYLTAATYDYNRVQEDKNRQVSYNRTGIVKIDVDGTSLKYAGSAQVDGGVDGQFSFSEKDGYLRVATTSDTTNGSVSSLYVLDGDLETVGTVNNIAPGERIYSVRYVGDMGYIVTFKQVDPLFAIDLSDPENPVVLGELKVPGFSEYMQPIDDETLLGFGFNTVTNQWGGVTTDGLKLSLFDVSDPEKPTETQSYPIGNSGSSSQAIYNHKAFMYYPQRRLVGLPVSVHTSSAMGWGGETFSGLLLFEVSKDGFKLYGQIASRTSDGGGFGRYESQYEISRGVYIGDVIYTFSDGCIMSHRLRAGLPKIGEYLFEA